MRVSDMTENDSPAPSDATRPTAQPLIAHFMAAINQSMRLFWKLPKRWLITLAEALHRECTPDIVHQLNKQAIACSGVP
jgi:hypothetical protein